MYLLDVPEGTCTNIICIPPVLTSPKSEIDFQIFKEELFFKNNTFYFPSKFKSKQHTTASLPGHLVHFLSKPKRSQTLVQRSLHWTHVAKHQHFRVTAERVLKHVCQFRVAIRYVAVRIACQSTNDVSKARQTFVDALRLF